MKSKRKHLQSAHRIARAINHATTRKAKARHARAVAKHVKALSK